MKRKGLPGETSRDDWEETLSIRPRLQEKNAKKWKGCSCDTGNPMDRQKTAYIQREKGTRFE